MVERKIFISFASRECDDCKEVMEVGDFIVRKSEGYLTCLKCAGLEHLVFLPAGDACVTRRAKKYSGSWEEVVRFNRRHKRNERQGILVEKEALEKAQKSCREDQAERDKKKEKATQKRLVQDFQHLENFTAAIRENYPSCPDEDVREIAERACEKYSRRVGRSRMAKEGSDYAVSLAVRAHIRHNYTDYDSLCGPGSDRRLAREIVKGRVNDIEFEWAQYPDPKKGKKHFPQKFDPDYESMLLDDD